MGLFDQLFSEGVDLMKMDTERIKHWFETEEFVSDMEEVINKFNGDVFKNITRRHDIPADVRIILDKYSIISSELVECLSLATDAESGMMIGERKEDA